MSMLNTKIPVIFCDIVNNRQFFDADELSILERTVYNFKLKVIEPS